jgi:hypothetical protein
VLTNQDLTQIETIVDKKLDEKLEGLATNADLKFLPTKDEFYEAMDQIMGELKAIREEQALLTGEVSDHDDRLELLEELHPNNAQPLTIKAAYPFLLQSPY